MSDKTREQLTVDEAVNLQQFLEELYDGKQYLTNRSKKDVSVGFITGAECAVWVHGWEIQIFPRMVGTQLSLRVAKLHEELSKKGVYLETAYKFDNIGNQYCSITFYDIPTKKRV